MEAAPQAKRARLDEAAPSASEWDHDCQAVITFRLIEALADAAAIEEEVALGGIPFPAEFFHQHFGEEERIKGYKVRWMGREGASDSCTPPLRMGA